MEGSAQTPSLLNPLDRSAEILFGLIMALSFTCTISLSAAHDAGIMPLLMGAIGCNTAWGIVDATMYLIGVLAEKRRNKILFDALQNPAKKELAGRYLSNAMPPLLASVMEPEVLEQIRKKLSQVPDVSGHVRLTFQDIKYALALFLLVFISTFPVVIPFVLIKDARLALRVSNLVALVMMFICGWSVAKYAGFSKWKMSIAMIMVGVVLVVITIALGG